MGENMEKEYCVVFKTKRKHLLWQDEEMSDFVTLYGHQAKSVLNEVKDLFPGTFDHKVYVEYKERKRGE